MTKAADFVLHPDLDQKSRVQHQTQDSDATQQGPSRTLTPSPRSRLNSMKAATTLSTHGVADGKLLTVHHSPLIRSAPKMQTIRPVASFEGSDTSDERLSIGTKNSAFSSSVNSNASVVTSLSLAASSSTSDQPTERIPSIRLKTNGSTTSQQQQLLNGSSTKPPASPIEPEDRFGGNSNRVASSLSPISNMDGTGGTNTSWDSAVGKAGLGKTGRVINKLVSDNEALRRDLKIERLRADEARQAARLLEDRMERLAAEHEGRLLEASVNRTLLARKERQVETLTASVEAERARAAEARDREKGWKEEMERAAAEAKTRIEAAAEKAALMEGRYTAIASHWREQGDEVRRALGKMRGEAKGLAEERRRDDERIEALRDLCDQQDGNIRELRRQKAEMARAFDDYKRLQEELLAGIKASARAREEEQERLLEETKEALDKLRWALNVRENVKGAQ